MGNITTYRNQILDDMTPDTPEDAGELDSEWAIPHEEDQEPLKTPEDEVHLAERALRALLLEALQALEKHDLVTLNNRKYELLHKASDYLGACEYADACQRSALKGLVF